MDDCLLSCFVLIIECSSLAQLEDQLFVEDEKLRLLELEGILLRFAFCLCSGGGCACVGMCCDL